MYKQQALVRRMEEQLMNLRNETDKLRTRIDMGTRELQAPYLDAISKFEKLEGGLQAVKCGIRDCDEKTAQSMIEKIEQASQYLYREVQDLLKQSS